MPEQPPQPDLPKPAGTDVLDWIVTNYLGAKIQASHIMNYNGANLAFNHGRDIAKKLGLDPAQITPFPCPTNVSVSTESVQPPAKPSPAASPLLKAGIAAALVGSGAGLIPIAQWVMDRWSSPAEAVTPVDDQNANVGFEIR